MSIDSNYPDDIDYQNKRGNSPFADDDDSDWDDESQYEEEMQERLRDDRYETDRRN